MNGEEYFCARQGGDRQSGAAALATVGLRLALLVLVLCVRQSGRTGLLGGEREREVVRKTKEANMGDVSLSFVCGWKQALLVTPDVSAHLNAVCMNASRNNSNKSKKAVENKRRGLELNWKFQEVRTASLVRISIVQVDGASDDIFHLYVSFSFLFSWVRCDFSSLRLFLFSLFLGASPQKRNAQPVVCEGCKGSGLCECNFCKGSGYMRLGDMFLCSTTSCECSVCKGTGDIPCTNCRGTGMRAAWML